MDPMLITFVVLIVAIVLYATEKIPLAATSILIVIALSVTGVLSASEALSGFSNTTVVLFACIFVLGGALERTSISIRIGHTLHRFENNERALITMTMVVTTAFSAFLSNTAVAAILLPIVLSICKSIRMSPSKLLLPMATGAVIGGGITLIGGPGNAAVVTALENITNGAQTYAFFDFTIAGLPIAIVAALYVWLIGWRTLPDHEVDFDAIEVEEKTSAAMSPSKEKLTYVVVLATVVGLIFSAQIGLDTWLIAMIGAIVLVLLGIMPEKQALNSISWKTLIMFAGVLPLTTAMDNTGASELLGSWIVGIIGDSANVFLITAVVFGISAIITQFMSNTASLALLCPLAGIIATQMGADPRSLIMAAASGCALSICTPIGAPPQALIYGPGHYKFMDYIRFAGPILILCWLFSTFYLPIVWPYF